MILSGKRVGCGVKRTVKIYPTVIAAPQKAVVVTPAQMTAQMKVSSVRQMLIAKGHIIPVATTDGK